MRVSEGCQKFRRRSNTCEAYPPCPKASESSQKLSNVSEGASTPGSWLSKATKNPEGFQRLPKALEHLRNSLTVSVGVRKFPKALESFRRDQRPRIIWVSVGSCPTVSEGVRKFPKAFESFRSDQHSRIKIELPKATKSFRRLPKAFEHLRSFPTVSEGVPESSQKLLKVSEGTSTPGSGLGFLSPAKMSKGSKKLQTLSNTSESSPWCLKASECFRKL